MGLKDITHSDAKEYSQAEIDRMFWNYCMGLLELANALDGDDNILIKLNSLADGRRLAMRRAFNYNEGKHFVAPSFTIHYRYSGTSFSIVETKV